MTIAIIGRGAMGATHASAWARLGLGEQISAVCATRPGPPLMEAPGARVVTDVRHVLDDPDVDVVSICTPTPTHADLAIRCLRAGKNVLLEKPIALTMADAHAIRRAASESGRILMVAHVVRFFEGYRLVRGGVESGQLGTVLSARAHRIIAAPAAAPWWHDEAQSGGVVVDVGIHDFDQLNLVLGQARTVRATRGRPKGPIETTIEYAGGGLGQVLSFAGATPAVSFSTSLEVLGGRGVAEYRYTAADASADVDADPIGSAVGRRTESSRFTIASEVGSRSAVVAVDEPYVRQAEYFLHCVRSGVEPGYCPTDAAIDALEVALAARASLVGGGRRIRLGQYSV